LRLPADGFLLTIKELYIIQALQKQKPTLTTPMTIHIKTNQHTDNAKTCFWETPSKKQKVREKISLNMPRSILYKIKFVFFIVFIAFRDHYLLFFDIDHSTINYKHNINYSIIVIHKPPLKRACLST